MHISRWLVPALVATVALAGCTTPTTTPTDPTPAPVTPGAAAPSPIGPDPAGGPGTPGQFGGGRGPAWATQTPSTQTTTGAVATPEPGTPQAAAWDALMGPDGEYAAAASYQAVLDEYGAETEPYASIRMMEENHINALTRQLQRFGITAPANPYLGEIEAPASLTEAAQAWVEGEELNVAMYDDLFAQVEGDPGLTRVFTNLRRSSEEAHLPLFRAAAENGGTLTAEQMTDLGFVPHR